jgi:predicted nuclease of predicted toxin-antitoxin system
MKLLLDQGTPRSATSILSKAGFDVVHTGDIGLATAKDQEILRFAREQGRTVITLDADFHMHLALGQAKGPSVIRIRIEGLRSREFSSVVKDVIHQCSVELEAGAMITVDDRRIRLRHL